MALSEQEQAVFDNLVKENQWFDDLPTQQQPTPWSAERLFQSPAIRYLAIILGCVLAMAASVVILLCITEIYYNFRLPFQP